MTSASPQSLNMLLIMSCYGNLQERLELIKHNSVTTNDSSFSK